MIWLTVRQHRIHIIAILAVSVLLAIALVVAADYAVRVRAELGADTCVPLPNTNANCVDLDDQWRQRVGSLTYLFYALYVLPGLVASYIGGPLFAIEFEKGTHRLAWTQSISRMRWAAAKLGVVLLAAVAVGLVLAPFGGGQRAFLGRRLVSPFETFEIEGVALVSYFVFGLVAGAFIGAWSRRIVTGMFVGLLVFGIVRIGIHNLRPNYEQPVAVEFAPYTPLAPRTGSGPGVPPDAWLLGVKGFDPEGRPVPDQRLNSLIQEYFSTPRFNQSDSAFLLEHGVTRRTLYQPADRFWKFQAIEAAIFTGLAALFALLTLWRVKTRDA